MTDFTFPSLAAPDRRAFVLHGDSMALWDQGYRSSADHLAPWAGWFETYGDGMVQHSHERVVALPEMMADYCASLATYLLEDEGPEIAEAQRVAHSNFPRYLPIDKVGFTMTVKHKEGKRQWFSLSEKKVSRSESKQHDNRWQEVKPWMDGSLGAVIGLLSAGRNDEFLGSFTLVEEVKAEYERLTGGFWGSSFDLMRLEERGWDRHLFSHFRQAWQALDEVVKSYGHLEYARSTLDCYRHNTELKDREEVTA